MDKQNIKFQNISLSVTFHIKCTQQHAQNFLLSLHFCLEHCLQSLRQQTAPTAFISVTQHHGCSTTQPAGYWTCEAFPCSEDISHKQSLKTARDRLALRVIDCWNQSHKNDCIGSWVSESINYRAMPADLNIFSPPSTPLSPQPRWGIQHVIDVSLICFVVETCLTLICIRVFSREKLYLSL